MDAMETLLLMLTIMDIKTVWFQKLVSHSKLQFGQLADHKDVKDQEMELHIVNLQECAPVVLLITHNI